MNYTDFLLESAKERQSMVCFGMDPVLEEIPLQGLGTEETIVKFYQTVLDTFESEDVWPSACKPNYAFFAQYGFDGLRALQKVCEMVKGKNLPLILDAKRGDIGKTSAAYAVEVFSFWKADSVTLSPYMGYDSIQPFVQWCKDKGKGVYVLARTSNPSAVDFQSLQTDGEPLYLKVSEKILEWSKEANGNIGAVIGATSPAELRQIHALFENFPVPYLIPGVGKQGGSLEEVLSIIAAPEKTAHLHRINSSSELNYAYKKTGTTDFAGASVKALKEMNGSAKKLF